ncbi:MAG: hypothetical protein R3D80_13310 [Paracoccaceae bacterium]
MKQPKIRCGNRHLRVFDGNEHQRGYRRRRVAPGDEAGRNLETGAARRWRD